jgi:hypothetical protein
MTSAEALRRYKASQADVPAAAVTAELAGFGVVA